MSLILSNESYAINGAAFEVYKQLGAGFLESVYQEALEIELNKREIPFDAQKELIIYYNGMPLKKKYVPDFVCYNKIIVEIKAVTCLENAHRAQVYNYLKATHSKLGLLYNFGHADGLEWERCVY